MKKIIFGIITIGIIGVVWLLVSPLFINTEVNEELPIQNLANRAAPEDTVVGNDVVVSEDMESMNIQENEAAVEERGVFSGADEFHEAEGIVKIVRDGKKTYVRFEDFEVTNGPDLFVTLNKNIEPTSDNFGEHVIIAPLKGNIGDQNYDISAYNVDEFESVAIYCRAFSTVFGSAQL